MKHFRIYFLIFIFILLLSFKQIAFAVTVVDADIITDTTWTAEESPYVVNVPVSISTNVTLTIEPDVIVKFNYGSFLLVDGTLNALGITDKPIYFTSYYDDSIGGDTNNDLENSVSFIGDWGGIQIGSITQSILNHIFLKYSGSGISLHNSGSIISDSLDSDQGIFLLGSHSSFINLTVPSIEIINGSVVSIDKATIVKNLDDYNYGNSIAVWGGSSLTLKNATVQNLGFGDIVDIFQDSSAIFDNVNFIGDIFSNTGIVVYNNSSLNLNKSSITDTEDGLVIYNDSSVTITDSSFMCENDGISIFNNSVINFSKGSVSCGHDGIVLFSEAKAVIDDVKISGATDAGIIAFSNFNPNQIDITKSEITGNENGFVVFDTGISVHQSSIHNNTSGVIAFSPLDPNQFDFTSNYWGNSSGPTHTINPTGLGDIVSDDVLFTPWLIYDPLIERTPVIIVPGVMGTEINKTTPSGTEKLWLDLAHNLSDIGDQFMDALQFNDDLTSLDTSLTIGDVIKRVTVDLGVGEATLYNYSFSLVDEFENQGYVEGTDLFLFSYDWRYGVSEDNVNKLKQKITDVLTQTSATKVDIVAHSTGGLLVKKYVVENPTNNHINKAVFVGVPNTGAPKAIKIFLQGDGFNIPWLSDEEMKKISKNLPVVYDLSPSEQYFNTKGSYIRTINQHGLTYDPPVDLDFAQSNNFLIDDHNLNAQALTNAHILHTLEFDNYDLRTAGVDLYSINGCKTGTLGKMVEVRYHNFIFGDSVSYAVPKEVIGDGTVPFESATNLPIDESNKYYALKADHGKMLSQEGIRQEIVNIFSDSELETENITQDISKCKLNGKAISIFSPLSIDIVDQDGNHTGLASDGVSIENNIPNADFQIIGEHKFVYLPTDDGQTYTISVIGTGTGTFTITDATISDNIITQTQVFSNISVTPSLTGHIILSNDTNTTLSLDTNGDNITDQTLQPSSVLNETQSQDFVPEPPNDNTQNDTPVVSQHRGGSILLLAQNNLVIESEIVPPPIIVTEIPAEVPIKKQENNSKILGLKKDTITTQIITIPVKVENLIKENTLTANIADSKIPINNKIVLSVFIGSVVLLLVAKFIIKV